MEFVKHSIDEYKKTHQDLQTRMTTMTSRKEFDDVEKLLQKNSDLLGTIKAELGSITGTQAANYKTQVAKYKDECEEAKKKFKRMKKDRLNTDYLFAEDPEKTVSEPLLGSDPHKKDQQKLIAEDLETMAYVGREADMIAGDTAAELARNKQVMIGTSSKVTFRSNLEQKAEPYSNFECSTNHRNREAAAQIRPYGEGSIFRLYRSIHVRHHLQIVKVLVLAIQTLIIMSNSPTNHLSMGFGVWGLGFGVWGLGDRKS